MKITTLLLLITVMTVSAATYAQKINLHEKKASLEQVLEKIRIQSGYDLIYSDIMLDKSIPVTINLKDATLDEALQASLEGQPLSYQIQDGTVVFRVKQPGILDKMKSALNLDKIDVRGMVIDENNQRLTGATVLVKGTGNVTTTDQFGLFILKGVDPNATIVITFIGYDKTELPATSDMGRIKLSIASSPLDEVKVIAYGQTTQRLSVGNVASVSAKDIEKQPVGNPLLALEGRVPGLFITPSNGLPGSGVTVRIQGQNSIVNGSDPLYVIDGVPYSSQTLATTIAGPLGRSSGGPGSGGGSNPMNFVNPSDIESISILKDADATSIYGSRAANGAILIITKKGKGGQTKVNFDIQNGIGQVSHFLDLMNTQQYLQMRHEALNNDGASITPFTYDLNGSWDTTRYTSWQKTLIGNTAHYANYNVSVSGGNDNTQYLVGSTFHRETSVFPGDFADQKGSLHFSLNTASSNQKFKMQLTGSYLFDDNQLPNTDLTATALGLAPDAPPLFKSDGTLNWQLNSSGTAIWSNPLAPTRYQTYQNKTYNLISNMLLSYTILPGLDIKTSLGYNNLRSNQLQANSLLYLAPAFQASRGTNGRSAVYANNDVNSWIIEPQLTFNKQLSKGKLDVLIGATLQQNNSNGLQYGGSGFSSDALLSDYASASTKNPVSSVQSTYKYDALYGRINYSWAEKYIIDVTARRDGSSRFGPASQFHNFASAGLGWIFSEERTVKDNLSFLSFGKLRGSYGITGNDQIGDYKFLSLYNNSTVNVGVPYQGITGLSATGLPNPYLQWEETRKLQAGIDLGFLKDRILLTANYVYNRSSNQLVNETLPTVAGFVSISTNLPATIQNTAWELTLNTTNIKGRDFRWNTSINLTIPNNKLVAYPNYNGAFSGVGYSLGTRKVFHFLGVDPATGQYQFEDSHGNPTLNPIAGTDDNFFVNPNFPKYYGGLQNSFSYKGFTLDVLFQFVKQIQTNYIFGKAIPGNSGVNEPVYLLGAWQKPGDISNVERYSSDFSLFSSFGTASTASDAAFSDASFIRLKNASLSYQLPTHFLQKAHIQNLRIYMLGQNLLTITKFKGLDPETGSVVLPPLRVLTLGLQVGL